jgi:uncharacterized protein (DUF1800 family)
MITTSAPLLEKMCLFWHGIFATGYPKVIHGKVLWDQIKMFRRHGMGRLDTLLVELSQDPATHYRTLFSSLAQDMERDRNPEPLIEKVLK